MYEARTLVFITFTLCLAIINSQANEACDKSQCRGPIQYYKELKCKPIYRNPDDCCPYKYNCDHLKTRLPSKCYIGDHEYNIGDTLRKEDKQPCDIDCFCRDNQGIAQFTCAIVDCFHDVGHPGCYQRRKATQCCAHIYCPEPDEERPTCLVDGKVYNDGESFTPASEPNKICYCGPGYANENVEPFCRVYIDTCSTELRHPYDPSDRCIPTFDSSQSPQTDCHYAHRCHNEKDKVIQKSKDAENPNEANDMTCKFGDLIMQYGDELNQATDYGSVCMNCTCEVGPIPTCQRLPDEVCDITKHPKFDNF